MSNCVLLDEYRHNLSAALGHLPGDEGDLEEEEEQEEEEGEGGEERARTDLCEKEDKKEEEKEKEENDEEKRDLSEEKAEVIKLLENGLAGNDVGQEYKGGFDRIMDSENGANMSE